MPPFGLRLSCRRWSPLFARFTAARADLLGMEECAHDSIAEARLHRKYGCTSRWLLQQSDDRPLAAVGWAKQSVPTKRRRPVGTARKSAPLPTLQVIRSKWHYGGGLIILYSSLTSRGDNDLIRHSLPTNDMSAEQLCAPPHRRALAQPAVATGGGAVLKFPNTGAIFLHLQTSRRCDEVRARLPRRSKCLKLRAGFASAAQASSQTDILGLTAVKIASA